MNCFIVGTEGSQSGQSAKEAKPEEPKQGQSKQAPEAQQASAPSQQQQQPTEQPGQQQHRQPGIRFPRRRLPDGTRISDLPFDEQQQYGPGWHAIVALLSIFIWETLSIVALDLPVL